MRNSLISLTLVFAALAGSAALLIASEKQQGQPGLSPARFWINNRTRDEAIPVNIVTVDPKTQPLPVSVTGFAAVDFTEHAVGVLSQIQARTQTTTRSRQPWEYRELSFTPNQPMAGSLNSLGSEGWEVAGIATQSNGNSTVLLKRPR
jgi:hypothetical protein